MLLEEKAAVEDVLLYPCWHIDMAWDDTLAIWAVCSQPNWGCFQTLTTKKIEDDEIHVNRSTVLAVNEDWTCRFWRQWLEASCESVASLIRPLLRATSFFKQVMHSRVRSFLFLKYRTCLRSIFGGQNVFVICTGLRFIAYKKSWTRVLLPAIVQFCRSNLVFSTFLSSIMPASRRAFGVYVSKFKSGQCPSKQIPSLISISVHPLIRIDFWTDLIKDPRTVQSPMILLALRVFSGFPSITTFGLWKLL